MRTTVFCFLVSMCSFTFILFVPCIFCYINSYQPIKWLSAVVGNCIYMCSFVLFSSMFLFSSLFYFLVCMFSHVFCFPVCMCSSVFCFVVCMRSFGFCGLFSNVMCSPNQVCVTVSRIRTWLLLSIPCAIHFSLNIRSFDAASLSKL